MAIEHGERIAVLETRVDELEKKTEKLESIDKNLTKMTVLFERYQEHTEKQDKILEEVRIDGKETKSKIVDLQNKVNDLGIKFDEAENKNIIKIDKRTFWRKTIPWIFGSLGGIGGILTLVLKLFGII